jgi:hypothetical protein
MNFRIRAGVFAGNVNLQNFVVVRTCLPRLVPRRRPAHSHDPRLLYARLTHDPQTSLLTPTMTDQIPAYDTQPHPYLHEPRIYLSNLPAWVSNEQLGLALQPCVPFRPTIPRDGSGAPLSGCIDFKALHQGLSPRVCALSVACGANAHAPAEKALATLHGRPLPEVHPPVLLALSPFAPGCAPPALPPAQAAPRLVKLLPPGFTSAQVFDLFRPHGPLAAVRMGGPGLAPDAAVVEFWREEDARGAADALHCADVEGYSIAIQLYQPRRTSGLVSELHASAPTFVPISQVYQYPSSVGHSFICEASLLTPNQSAPTTNVLPVAPARQPIHSHHATVYARAWPAGPAGPARPVAQRLDRPVQPVLQESGRRLRLERAVLYLPPCERQLFWRSQQC